MTDPWLPLSARLSAEAAKAHETLHEGIPPHLVEALRYWLLTECLNLPTGNQPVRDDEELLGSTFLRDFEVQSGRSVVRYNSVRDALEMPFLDPGSNRDLLLDMLDFAAHATTHAAMTLKKLLDQGRSAWTVDLDTKGLVRRVPGAEAALASLQGMPAATARLHSAWTKAFGLHADPTAAYDEAVRAVEAAYCSAILPRKNLPTLGVVNRALRDDPAKLQHVWPATDENGRSAAEATRALMQLLERNQGWRHGSEGSKDPKAPKSASLEQARAAVHLALLLISWKLSGSVIPAPKP